MTEHIHDYYMYANILLPLQSTDGGMISKAKGLAPSSSNVTKSTSALPPATKNTKNDEIKTRDNKMKKTGSSSTIITDPKKRLMVEEAKGKVRPDQINYLFQGSGGSIVVVFREKKGIIDRRGLSSTIDNGI